MTANRISIRKTTIGTDTPAAHAARAHRGGLSLVLLASAAMLGAANAQWGMDALLQQNLAFDQQMQAQMDALWAQNQAQYASIFDEALRAFGPQIEQDWRAYQYATGQAIDFYTFTYYWILTAGGTDPQGGLQAMRESFAGLQAAHATVQSGYDDYNAAASANSARTDGVLQAYGDAAVLGNGYWENPYTGEIFTLPYTSGPGYYDVGGTTFYLDPSGAYYQNTASGWLQLDPRARNP